MEVLTSWPADIPPLGDATVAIIGCGGLGTWALGGLACAGIGSFVLVDDDTVDPSNLNRQVLYVDADIVILLADWPPYELERWVNEACFAASTPYISCGQATPIMKLGPMYVPGRTPCFACEETQMRTASPLYDDVVALLGAGRARPGVRGLRRSR